MNYDEIKNCKTFFLIDADNQEIKFRIYEGSAPKVGGIVIVDGIKFECVNHEYIYTEHYRDFYAVIVTLKIKL